MQSADRKLAWAAVAAGAIIAAEIAWFLFIGPTDTRPNSTAHCTENCEVPWYISATAWTCLFTFVLTVSTVLMWWETRKLAQGADDQSAKMADSIAAAKKSADAANLHARIILEQMQPFIVMTGRRIEFQRERASPAGRIFGVGPGEMASGTHGVITLHNAGGGNAKIVSATADWFLGHEPPPMPLRSPFVRVFIVLKGGQNHTLSLDSKPLTLLPGQAEAIRNGERLWFYAAVRYHDILNKLKEQGFIARWDDAVGVVSEGPSAYMEVIDVDDPFSP